ncbi:hypothetical protein N9K16_03295 [Alphaproteobacteria bacterium]|jgi:hypothetical protein|nr:hypothetical protein [Alphaproteobacteria bacterium]
MLAIAISVALQIWLMTAEQSKLESRAFDQSLALEMFVVFDPITGELVEFRADPDTQTRYKEYLDLPQPKAFALSPSKVWTYSDSPEAALAECTSYLRSGEFSCFVADINGQIVVEEPVWLKLVE